MAEKKFLDLTGLQNYDEKLKTHVAEADTKVLNDAKSYADGLADNYDAAGTAATKVQELADGAVATNTASISKLNGDATVVGSVAKAVADAKALIDTDIAAVQSNVDALIPRVTAVESDVGDLDTLGTTAKTDLVAAINEVRNSVSAGGTAAAITIDTSTTTDGYLKSYTIKQGDNTIGTIDIPKDMVVESGSVVTISDLEATETLPVGTYIKLVLVNVAEPLYINVGTLVDIYIAKAEAAQVQIEINSVTREVSAYIVAGSIGATELASNAVTTAKIADANVTRAKLSIDVQGSLDKADSAEANANSYTDGKVAENKTLIDTNATNIASLESKVGDGFTEITVTEIDAMFVSTN